MAIEAMSMAPGSNPARLLCSRESALARLGDFTAKVVF